ncbi:MAG: tyrosine-type recombinase/integrase, partial [Candidatus Scatosoma sp.]
KNAPTPTQNVMNSAPGNNVEENEGIVNFTEKEIQSMPKTLQRIMRVGKFNVRVRKRETGKNKFTYELRYRKNGFVIEACGKTKELAKANFLKKARAAQPKYKTYSSDSFECFPKTFTAFSQYYFERFREKKVAPQTYKTDLLRFKKYLAPHFAEMDFTSITPSYCQNLFDKEELREKGRTIEELFGLLSVIFKAAIAHSLMTKNPLDLIVKTKHRRVHGKSLTNEEIAGMIKSLRGSKIELSCMLMLYTGARPNELETARIDGKFIVMKNSKRKTHEIEYKKIPILNALRPYLPQSGIIPALPSPNYLTLHFPKIVPNHKLYDLRTTFNTKCEEAGVANTARMKFMGHSLGTLRDTYTDLSDEYLLREADKLNGSGIFCPVSAPKSE